MRLLARLEISGETPSITPIQEDEVGDAEDELVADLVGYVHKDA